MKRLTFLFIYVFLSSIIEAQDKSPIHLGLNVQAGPSLNFVQNFDSIRFSSPIGYGLDLNFLTGYRWNDQFDFSLGLGIQYHEQSYQGQGVDYGVAYIGAQSIAGLQARIPLPKNPHSDLSISFKTGAFLVSGRERNRNQAGFNFSTQTNQGVRYFINPTIGLIKPIGQNYALLGLSFRLLLGNEPLAETNITGNGANSRSSFGNYYLGIEFRYDWHLKTKPISPTMPIDKIPELIRDRPVAKTKQMTVNKAYVTIEIWDHSAEDGDSISLELNGQLYLFEHEIKKAKKRIKVQLYKGLNVLTLMAHNTGREGENTCSIRIRAGRNRKTFKFLTNSRRNEAMDIIYE